jgi:hypothetical protein
MRTRGANATIVLIRDTVHHAVTIDRYTVSADPEPQTNALMAAGLAFASFAAIRRRRQDLNA